MFFYLHIPFCRQKCTYCKFALTPFVREAQVNRYLAHLGAEIGEFFDQGNPFEPSRHWTEQPIESIYFGGGTPSVLSVEQIREILDRFPRGFLSDVEITLEANPEDVTREWARGIRELWVNRVSLGIQSLSSDTLATVHRGPPEGIFSALAHLTEAKIPSINIDFILGLPYAKPGETLAGIRQIHAEFPDIAHTSVYFLEKWDYPRDWKGLGISDEEARTEFGQIREFLREERGFHHYEVSNFARPGHESRHNQSYWNHSEVRGFGLAAASYLSGERFENSSRFNDYYAGNAVDKEKLTDEQIRLEKWIFGLRTFSLDTRIISNPEKLAELLESGLLEKVVWSRESTRLDQACTVSPTLSWIFVLDHIMGELL